MGKKETERNAGEREKGDARVHEGDKIIAIIYAPDPSGRRVIIKIDPRSAQRETPTK